MLIIVGGLPATGKTTISRLLAQEIGAVHLRIDTIEQAIARSGHGQQPLGPVGYHVGYALAAEQLGQGLSVVAESVNPLEVTRAAWRAAAPDGVRVLEVEICCSDAAEHQRRAGSRTVDIPDLRLPTWPDIVDREYEPWTGAHVVLDTAGRSVPDCLAELRKAL